MQAPRGEPGETDGRLTVSRKWQAPLGLGASLPPAVPACVACCLREWPARLPQCLLREPGVGAEAEGQLPLSLCPPWGGGAPWRTAREGWALARPAFPLQPRHLRRWGRVGHSVPAPSRSRCFPVCWQEADGDFISDLPIQCSAPCLSSVRLAAVPSFPGTAPAPQLLSECRVEVPSCCVLGQEVETPVASAIGPAALPRVGRSLQVALLFGLCEALSG